MTTLRRLMGQAAVSLADAGEAGHASAVVIDDGRITMIELDSGRQLPASAVRSFEGEVLTYEGEAGAAPANDAAVAPRASKVIGLLALTDLGDALGTIDDLEVDADGTLGTLHLTDGSVLDGARITVAGDYAAMIGGTAPEGARPVELPMATSGLTPIDAATGGDAGAHLILPGE